MSSKRTSMELPSDTEIVITRTFRAEPSVVFDAYTKPEFVRRWWAPASRGVTLLECTGDVRPGGAYRYVLARAGAVLAAFSGRYIEVVRPARLVYTQCLEPYPDEVLVTISFEPHDGATKLVAHERYPSAEVRAAALSSGMEEGMRETLDLLDELVLSLSAG
jgi:uncharacterized protein YndB with AHSA1/START domain